MHDPQPPTLEEIRAACAEIQAGWSEAERQNRIVNDRHRRREVSIPAVSLPGIEEATTQ